MGDNLTGSENISFPELRLFSVWTVDQECRDELNEPKKEASWISVQPTNILRTYVRTNFSS